MKKLLIMLTVVAMMTTPGCKKKTTNGEDATLNNQDLVAQIFNAGMSAYSLGQALKGTYPVNYQADKQVAGPEGGYIHVTGSVTGSITLNDQTGALISGIIQLAFTETINDFAFKSNGGTYVMNGDPYISLTGTFTLVPGGLFGTASSMQIGGGVKVNGPNFNRSVNIQLTIIINSNGSGGHVSGTIDGIGVDYTF
ncbi:MAG: hypothetical protein WCO93_11605 [bacterium]